MRNDAKLKIAKWFYGNKRCFWLVSGGQSEMHVVEPYDAHGEADWVLIQMKILIIVMSIMKCLVGDHYI